MPVLRPRRSREGGRAATTSRARGAAPTSGLEILALVAGGKGCCCGTPAEDEAGQRLHARGGRGIRRQGVPRQHRRGALPGFELYGDAVLRFVSYPDDTDVAFLPGFENVANSTEIRAEMIVVRFLPQAVHPLLLAFIAEAGNRAYNLAAIVYY